MEDHKMNAKIISTILMGSILLGLMIVPSADATVYQIGITVEDMDENHIAGALVVCTKAGGIPQVETTRAIDGTAVFSLFTMPGDSFIFTVSREGYIGNSADWVYDGDGMAGNIHIFLEESLSPQINPFNFSANIEVSDTTGSPLQDAKIYFNNQLTYTDSLGNNQFRFNDILNNLTVSKDGYEAQFFPGISSNFTKNVVLNRESTTFTNTTVQETGLSYFTPSTRMNASTLMEQSGARWIAMWDTDTSEFNYIYASQSRSPSDSSVIIEPSTGCALWVSQPYTVSESSTGVMSECTFQLPSTPSSSSYSVIVSSSTFPIQLSANAGEWVSFSTKQHEPFTLQIYSGSRLCLSNTVSLHNTYNLITPTLNLNSPMSGLSLVTPQPNKTLQLKGGLGLVGNPTNITMSVDDILNQSGLSWIAIPGQNGGFNYIYKGRIGSVIQIKPRQAFWCFSLRPLIYDVLPTTRAMSYAIVTFDVDWDIDGDESCEVIAENNGGTWIWHTDSNGQVTSGAINMELYAAVPYFISVRTLDGIIRYGQSHTFQEGESNVVIILIPW
jgi:hypothetical protein